MAIIQVAIVAALFGGGLVVTAGIVFVPGIAYLRPAQALVVVFGILFGVPGALGSALGNLIGDLFGGYLTLGSVAGFIGNFLNAYIPYRIVKTARYADLSSGADVARYVLGAIAGALVIGFYIPFWLDLWKIIPTEAAWTAVFGNILLNGTLTVLTLGLILTRLLFPFVKKWNMYWEDREAGARAHTIGPEVRQPA
jgi:energy-coupling factor transport system substrate-specific component